MLAVLCAWEHEAAEEPLHGNAPLMPVRGQCTSCCPAHHECVDRHQQIALGAVRLEHAHVHKAGHHHAHRPKSYRAD